MLDAPTSLARVVLDTNIVLDIFVFDEPSLQELKAALLLPTLDWIATHAMRLELQRVLGYPNIVRWMAKTEQQAEEVLHDDRRPHAVEALPVGPAGHRRMKVVT